MTKVLTIAPTYGTRLVYDIDNASFVEDSGDGHYTIGLGHTCLVTLSLFGYDSGVIRKLISTTTGGVKKSTNEREIVINDDTVLAVEWSVLGMCRSCGAANYVWDAGNNRPVCPSCGFEESQS
jgi:hypothetical protein